LTPTGRTRLRNGNGIARANRLGSAGDYGGNRVWHGSCFSFCHRTGIQPAVGNLVRHPPQFIDTPPPLSPPAPPAVPIHPTARDPGAEPAPARRVAVLRWSLVFLIVALVAGLFGFTELYAPAMLIAKVLFFVFLLLFVVSLLLGSRTAQDV